MANPKIKVKRSSVEGKVPAVSQLERGELAVNSYDGKVYILKDQFSVGIATTTHTINPWNEPNGVGAGISYSGDIKVIGVITATSFDGGLPITNGANNRIITATSASAIQGESGLTYDGTTLSHAGSGFKEIQVAPSTNNSATLRLRNSQANYTVSNITGGSFSIADGNSTRFTINSS